MPERKPAGDGSDENVVAIAAGIFRASESSRLASSNGADHVQDQESSWKKIGRSEALR
jgi:hypothetical protein